MNSKGKKTQHKINLDFQTLPHSLINETTAFDADHSHAVKSASFAKTLIEKEKTLKYLITFQGKLEDEYKAL